MQRRRLLWQLYPSFLLITLLSLAAVTLYGAGVVRRMHVAQLDDDLAALARIAEESLATSIAGGDVPAVRERADTYARITGTRITIVAPLGLVMADSEEAPAVMDNHADRPEIAAALIGERGMSVRYSHTSRKPMMYVAVPSHFDGETAGVVRVALPMSRIEGVLYRMYWTVAGGWLVIALLAAGVSLNLSRKYSRPIEELTRAATRLADGDLRVRVPVHASSETADLAGTMNRAAELLEERFTALIQKSTEQEAVLSSMAEGVIAVDSSNAIINMNLAAASMFDIDAERATGRIIQEAVRNTDLQNFVAQTFAGAGPVEGDIVLRQEPPRFLQAHGSVLRDRHDRSIGALVVLNDVTRLRRLERVRSEFVANVSHELKTPITSIKGFVETLGDGAIHNTEDAHRFLGIIQRHTDRLNSIVEDLLALSRIEQDVERGAVATEERGIAPILRAAVQLCRHTSDERRVTVRIECDDELSARVNAPLLEQAVVNLVDNAAKYSGEGATVEVSAAGRDRLLRVAVSDSGPGIEAHHLERVFERFYRVDRGRSRDLGGTGLGLAIVKHIAHAMGGSADATSTPGEGSTFTISVPV